MNNPTGLIVVLLVAVLVGGLLPVLYHLVQTLKSAKQFLDQTGRSLDEALKEVTETASRINRVAATLEHEAERLKPVLDAAASVGETIHRARAAVNTASLAVAALAPAFLAGMKAFFEPKNDEPARTAGQGSDDDEDAETGHGV